MRQTGSRLCASRVPESRVASREWLEPEQLLDEKPSALEACGLMALVALVALVAQMMAHHPNPHNVI